MPLLTYERHGSGSTLVWLHGFTQTRESAHRFRTILAGSHELLTTDLPGHGTASDVRATLNETADLLASSLPDHPVALGGYSLGARVALHIALRHRERLSALIVLGASRGIEDASQRRERVVSDEALAARLETIGTERFLDEWLAQPMFATLPVDSRERQARSTDAAGLASSLRLCGTGTQAFLGPRLASLSLPTLCLAGERDQKFLAEARAIAAGVTSATMQSVPRAQHAAHLENPEASARLVTTFLALASSEEGHDEGATNEELGHRGRLQ
jgi:2-succinyl-6-hydroxy-2,4-cyclohexadiene-1-carboxylate synthase